MKKHSLITLAAILCSMVLSINVFAQKPTLEASLPAQMQKELPELKANIGFLMDKVLAVNPGFKNPQQVQANFTTALDQLKKQKPSIQTIKLPEINASSYDQLIATKTKQQGAESGAVKILTMFKEGVNKAADDAEVITLMATLVKSPTFQTLPQADKDMFYNGFAAAKAVADYAAKNNLTVMTGDDAQNRGVGGVNGAKNDDEEYYMARGAACHWFFTVAGGAIGAVAGAGVGAGAGAAIGFAAGAKACY